MAGLDAGKIREMFASQRMLFSVLAGFFALAALACLPSPASAGSYDVWSCRGPANEALGMDAWKPSYNEVQIGNFWVEYDCPTGGPFAMKMNNWDTGTRRPVFSMSFDLPRGATISGYRLYRAIETAPPDGPIYDYAGATREGAFPPYSDSGCKSSGIGGSFPCQNQGTSNPSSWDDPSNLVLRSSLALDGLSAWIGCVGDSGCNPALSVTTTAIYALHQSRVTINDPTNPVIDDLGGTLIEGEPLWGKANLSVEARDTVSGLKEIDLEIDGDPAGSALVDTGDCSLPYEVSAPCPRSIGKIFTVDTSLLGEGTHTAAGTVTDASGNTTGFGPVSFVVEEPDNPGPPDPDPDNGVPAVADPKASVEQGSISHKAGSTAMIEGRLTTQGGIPVVGAVLGAKLTQLAVSDPTTNQLPDAVTGADGGFSIPVAGSGARQVEIDFTPYSGAQAVPLATVKVRSRLGLTLQPRPAKVRIGRKVRFSGKLTGAGPSAAGVPVEIQARVAGKWSTVASVRSKANGSWVWTYRFRYVKRKALFSFRAVVSNVPGWPWPSVTSAVRKVRITVGRR